MFSFELTFDPRQKDLLVADLWEEGSSGIVEPGEGRLRAFFDDGADRAALLARFAPFDPQPRQEEQRDWVACAREKLEPMLAGTRFFLVPEWRDDPTPAGRLRIPVNPGMAFGTGAHETTRLCLAALERYVVPGATVLDVGTGSGILAQAAALLGAARVFACDNDPIAVPIARANAGAARVFAGSADAVAPESADLLVANISPEVVIALAPDFRRILRPGGTAILSGFEAHEAEAVRASLGAAVKETRTENTWALLVISGTGY